MIQEGNAVILLKDRPLEGLVKGDVGSVVFMHEGGKAYEIEFVTMTGDPLGVLTLAADVCSPKLQGLTA